MGGRGGVSHSGGLTAQQNAVIDNYIDMFQLGQFSREQAFSDAYGRTIVMSDGSIFQFYADEKELSSYLRDSLYKEKEGWGYAGMSDNGDTALLNYKDGTYTLLGHDYTARKPRTTGIKSAVTENSATTAIYGKPGKIKFENWDTDRIKKTHKTNREAYEDGDYSWRIDY